MRDQLSLARSISETISRPLAQGLDPPLFSHLKLRLSENQAPNYVVL